MAVGEREWYGNDTAEELSKYKKGEMQFSAEVDGVQTIWNDVKTFER